MERTIADNEFRIQMLIEMLLVNNEPTVKTIRELDKNLFVNKLFINVLSSLLEEGFCTKYNKEIFIEIISLFKNEWIKQDIISLEEYNDILKTIILSENINIPNYFNQEEKIHINSLILYKKMDEDIKEFIIKDFYVINYLFEPTPENMKKISHPAYFSAAIDKIVMVYPELLYNKDIIKNICEYIDVETAILLKDRKHLIKIVKEAKKNKFFIATNDYYNYKKCMAYLMGIDVDYNLESELVNCDSTIDNLFRIYELARETYCFEKFFISRAINLCKNINSDITKKLACNFETISTTNNYEFYLNEYRVKINRKIKKLTEEDIKKIRYSFYLEYLLINLIKEEDNFASFCKFEEYFAGKKIFLTILIKIFDENFAFINQYRNRIKNLLYINMSYIEKNSFEKKSMNKKLLKIL